MNKAGIDTKAIFRAAWLRYKANWGTLVPMVLAMFLAWVVLEISVVLGTRLGWPFSLAMHLVFGVVFAGIGAGLTAASLSVMRGEDARLGQLFSKMQFGPRLLVEQLAYFIVVLIGLAVFILPGVYWGTRFTFFAFVLLEDPTGFLDNFRMSQELVNSNFGAVLRILMIVLLLNILGAALLGIGFFFTLPFSLLVMAEVYLQLSHSS
jgi:hypothetical protein